MFATLLGGLPRPEVEGDGEDLVAVAVRAQEQAGLEPITDGRLIDPGFDELAGALIAGQQVIARDIAVDSWRATAALTDRAVKQALPGPYTLGRGQDALDATADAMRDIVVALAAAGCPFVEIEEVQLEPIGQDIVERHRFEAAHRRLADGVSGTHLSLSIVGGSVGETAWSAILDTQYASLAVDLIAGPDSWNLVTRLPGDRGVIVGVESPGERDEPKEVLLWAAHYAASTRGRGLDRVGIGSAGSYANLTWDAAVRKMRILGEAARLAALPPGEELARSLDPRAIDARRAALGHDAPSPRRERRRTST